MRFWIREIAGWTLILAGLYFFLVVMSLLLNEPEKYLEAGPLTIIGIIIYRGGIHLLKVAMAARVCLAVKHDEPKK